MIGRFGGSAGRARLMLAPALAGLCAASPAWAEDEGIEALAAMFGARETVLDISLSPSGEKVAFVSAGPEHTEVLSVIDLAGDAQVRRIVVNSEKIADLDFCEWASDTRLVCQASGMAKSGDGVLLPFERLFAIDDTGDNVQELSKRQSGMALGFVQQGGDVLALDVGGEQGQILMSRQSVH
ncbi:hypothetical protein OIK40_00970 [Erythrobacter sp. sf7]|uniref:S9 family peptidase n=1 Tax=Erythrobacter fulvus TaxID=2987523 RepID=A0ABT5JM56_9SPHN|nr:hypothetical protein [Erythrobacter fulvus]MDC8753208.1 hypothetical protein [Erythrobacter fulvus]